MTSATATMVTLQAYRLENTDGEHFKQYTIMAGGGRVLFFNSRIGNTWANQSPKAQPADPMGKALSQRRAKERGGYEEVWRGDITVPFSWADDPATFTRQLQDVAESAYRERRNSASASPSGSSPAQTDVDESPLASLLDDCRSLVSKLAVSSDVDLAGFAALQADVEKARDEMDRVDGYLDTLRLMIGAKAL